MKKLYLLVLSTAITMHTPAEAFLTSSSSSTVAAKSKTTSKQKTAVVATQKTSQHARRYALAPAPEHNYHYDAFDAKRPDGPNDWQPDAAAVKTEAEIKKVKPNRSIFNAVTN